MSACVTCGRPEVGHPRVHDCDEGHPYDWCPPCITYVAPAPTADPVDLRDGTRPWDEARAPEIDALAKVLHAAWREAEPNSLVSLYSASYLSTFADMARAVLPLIDAERAARETAEGRITELKDRIGVAVGMLHDSRDSRDVIDALWPSDPEPTP